MATQANTDFHGELAEAPSFDEPHLLSAEEIRAASDVAEAIVDVPEWGGSVRLHSITMDEAQRLTARLPKTGDDEADRMAQAKVLLVACCDSFSESDVAWIGEKNPVILGRLMRRIAPLVGMTDDEVMAAANTFPDAPADTVPVDPRS